MQKRTFSLLAIAYIFLCGCKTQTSKPPAQPPEPPVIEHTQEVRPITDPNVWDVTDVDVSHIHPDRKLIAFTYDDAPAAKLENLLAVFTAYNEANPDCIATATLFCNGNRIDETFSHTLRSALALGFELGNHTFSHPDLTKLSPLEIASEIDETDGVLSRLDGKPRHLFRAPYGKISEQVREQAQTPILNWTIDTLDWTGKTAQEIYDSVWEQKYAGAIVLMHDGYENTITAMKRLLPDLKQAGYQAVTVSQMSKAHDCPLRIGSVYIRARKKTP